MQTVHVYLKVHNSRSLEHVRQNMFCQNNPSPTKALFSRKIEDSCTETTSVMYIVFQWKIAKHF